jgi:hypothetical protein
MARADRAPRPAAAPRFDAEAATERLAKAVQNLTAENGRLNARLAALGHDMDGLTGSIARQVKNAAEKAAAERAAEAKASQLKASKEKAAPENAAQDEAQQEKAEQLGGAPAAPAAATNPASTPAAITVTPAAQAAPRPQGAAETTGSLPQIAATPQPSSGPVVSVGPASEMPPPERPTMEYGVDIGNALSIEVLHARWLGIRSAHGHLLEGLTPIAAVREMPQSKRLELRLVVGPLASAKRAAWLCGRLRRYRLRCAPTTFDSRDAALE